MTRQEIKDAIAQTFNEKQAEKLLPDFDMSQITVERPADVKNGDYSTNVALKIAPLVKKSSKEIAEILVGRLKEKILFAKIEIAPSGFINFYLLGEYLQEQIEEILQEQKNYGSLDLGHGQKVHIDFVSANPTGPVHIGNARGGPLGDVLGNVLGAVGYQVFREYYVNDTGNQAEVLGHSILGDDQAQYRGQYIENLRKKIKTADAKEAGQEGVMIILEEIIKPSMEKLGIKFDNWFSERELQMNGSADKVLDFLKKKWVYEKDGAWWFKASAFGDEKDRVVVKSTGEKTYFGSDIAYHKDKIERGFGKLIDVWGADHHGDVKRIMGALEALGYGGKLEIILTQFVRVLKGGQEIKMSKRAGTYVSIDDLIDEAGRDAIRFFFLMYSADTHMDFNLDLAKEQSEKNPVYYVQYAYARLSNILKKAIEEGVVFEMPLENLNLLKEPAELELIKQLIRFPEILEDTAGDYQVQRLPQYSLDLVRAFHKFYEECRVISDDKKLTKARLSLVEATRIVLKNTLDLMGISAPEKM